MKQKKRELSDEFSRRYQMSFLVFVSLRYITGADGLKRLQTLRLDDNSIVTNPDRPT